MCDCHTRRLKHRLSVSRTFSRLLKYVRLLPLKFLLQSHAAPALFVKVVYIVGRLRRPLDGPQLAALACTLYIVIPPAWRLLFTVHHDQCFFLWVPAKARAEVSVVVVWWWGLSVGAELNRGVFSTGSDKTKGVSF